VSLTNALTVLPWWPDLSGPIFRPAAPCFPTMRRPAGGARHSRTARACPCGRRFGRRQPPHEVLLFRLRGLDVRHTHRPRHGDLGACGGHKPTASSVRRPMPWSQAVFTNGVTLQSSPAIQRHLLHRRRACRQQLVRGDSACGFIPITSRRPAPTLSSFPRTRLTISCCLTMAQYAGAAPAVLQRHVRRQRDRRQRRRPRSGETVWVHTGIYNDGTVTAQASPASWPWPTWPGPRPVHGRAGRRGRDQHRGVADVGVVGRAREAAKVSTTGGRIPPPTADGRHRDVVSATPSSTSMNGRARPMSATPRGR